MSLYLCISISLSLSPIDDADVVEVDACFSQGELRFRRDSVWPKVGRAGSIMTEVRDARSCRRVVVVGRGREFAPRACPQVPRPSINAEELLQRRSGERAMEIEGEHISCMTTAVVASSKLDGEEGGGDRSPSGRAAPVTRSASPHRAALRTGTTVLETTNNESSNPYY